jgi:hypothetical protein
MGIFVNYPSNIFSSINNTARTIVNANTNVLWITDINICNRGAAPIRFNLQKVRTEGLMLENSCYVASTVNLSNVIYDNGSSGVGATLTNNAPTLTAFSIDGVTPPLNSRILIKDQAISFQNGIYILTTVGNNSIPWVLTRASDYNNINKIQVGDLVAVLNGTLNKNTTWLQNTTVTAIGTSPILFILYTPNSIFLINELEIAPYTTKDIIDITGVIHLEYNVTPYVSDSLRCFSNGYTQVFDCDVNYVQLNELPMS